MSLETRQQPILLSPEQWAKVDLMKAAIEKGIRSRHTCISCGRRAPIVWRVEPKSRPEAPGPNIGKAEDDDIRVTALKQARFCSLRCDMLFVQSRLRRDGPEARIAVGMFANRRK